MHLYLRNLEEIIIQFCIQSLQLLAYRIPEYTGVWLDDAKIAAIGIKVGRWVTMHGLSFNINPNLHYFRNIIPCGIQNKPVGSLAQRIPNISMETIKKDELFQQFEKIFNVQLIIPMKNEMIVDPSLQEELAFP